MFTVVVFVEWWICHQFVQQGRFCFLTSHKTISISFLAAWVCRNISSSSLLICFYIFSFCCCLPSSSSAPLLGSFLSPPVISWLQLTTSVLWVSALALSFIQPTRFAWTTHPSSAWASCFHDYFSHPLDYVFLNICLHSYPHPPWAVCDTAAVSSTFHCSSRPLFL